MIKDVKSPQVKIEVTGSKIIDLVHTWGGGSIWGTGVIWGQVQDSSTGSDVKIEEIMVPKSKIHSSTLKPKTSLNILKPKIVPSRSL